MPDLAGLKKPLHPFVTFVLIAAALIVALDIATGMVSYAKVMSQSARLGLGQDVLREALRPVLINFWISLAEQILLHVAYLIGLGVVVELLDRLLWRLTPEAERRRAR